MLERQLAERFRAMVANEPPFTVAPDALVDRLVRTGRRPWWTRRVPDGAIQPANSRT